jgi:hypothetical protein
MNQHLTPWLLFALIVALPSKASAELLVYEPFDYDEGILTGQSGALGTAGSWASHEFIYTDWRVHEEGEISDVGLSGSNVAIDPLGFNSFDGTVDNLATSGGYVGLHGAEDVGDDDPHNGEPGRHMDAHIGLAPSVTETFTSGTTTWFSFVSVRGWDRNEESPQFTIGTDFTPNNAREISYNTDGGGNAIGGGGGPPRANYGDILPSYFSGGIAHTTPGGYLGGILGEHDGVQDQQGSSGTSDGALETGVQTMVWQELDADDEFGAPNIVVGKIEWDADEDGEDIISVVRFLETDELSEDAFEDLIDAQPALSSANWDSNKPNLDQSEFDTLNFSGTKFFVDEIRLATTFREVVPSRGDRPPCDTVCENLTVEAIDGKAANVRATATASNGTGGSISYLFSADDGQGNVQNIGPQNANVADFDLPAGDWTISVEVSDDSNCAPPSENDSCSADPISVSGDPQFRRGDGNGDGGTDLSDAVFVLNYLFVGGAPPPCLAAANSNADNNVDIADPTYLLNHLFLGGTAPPLPFRDCGTSGFETDARLGCEETSCP